MPLSKCGARNYSRHPSTEVRVVAWAVGDGPVRVWHVDPWCAVPPEFEELYYRYPSAVWVAHNAAFERAIWQNVLARYFPRLHMPERWADTQMLAAQSGLPQALEDAARVLRLTDQKDTEGAELMKRLCAPDGDGQYRQRPGDKERLGQYCARDVETTRALWRQVAPWANASEMEIMRLHNEINDRGFYVDRDFARAARAVAAQVLADAVDRLRELTGGAITSPRQHARVAKFLNLPRGNRETLERVLETEPPGKRREMITLVLGTAKSSVAKYEAALLTSDPADSRIRGAFVYHQAATGRWAGRGFQPQNVPRGRNWTDAERDAAMAAVRAGDVDALSAFGAPMEVLSDLLRACIQAAPGKKLVAADFSGIEARGVMWFAGEVDAVRAIANGGDLYRAMAADIFGVREVDVTSDQRNVGKAAILGLGYGMGALRFMAQNDVPLDLAELAVKKYRNKYPGIPALWRRAEAAFLAAVEGKPTTALKPAATVARGAAYRRLDARRVALVLPSGRRVIYWDAKKAGKDRPTISRDTTRISVWGGFLVENLVQAAAADLLRNALVNVSKSWPVSMHVHDEIVCEIDESDPRGPEDLGFEMRRTPAWAEGWPVAAEGWQGLFFQKG